MVGDGDMRDSARQDIKDRPRLGVRPILLLVSVLLTGIAASRPLLVPEEHATTQAALLYARNGDTVSVKRPTLHSPPLHSSSIDLRGKRVVVVDRDSGVITPFSRYRWEENISHSPPSSHRADCGDCNDDGRITIADATYVVSYVYRAGPAPVGEGDVNLDGGITVADAVYLVNFIYRDGRPPCAEGWIGQRQVNEPDSLFDAEAILDMDPDGYPWAVWVGKEQAGDRDEEVFFTKWNGSSWEPEALVNPPDVLGDYRPTIALNDSGTAYVTWDHAAVTDDIWYSYWNGSAWEPPGPVHVSDDRDDYAPVVSAGGGEVWVVWYEGAAEGGRQYNVFAARWSGSEWDQPMQVSPPDNTHDWWANIAVDASGNPHVVYSVYRNGGIYYTTYDGSSWTSRVLLNDTTFVQGYDPAVGIDDSGNVHVVWVGIWLHPVVDYDIYYSFSSDGVNWSAPTMINEDDDVSDRWARIAVISLNDVLAAWYKEYSVWNNEVFTSHFDGAVWSPESKLNNETTMTNQLPSIALSYRDNP